MATDSRPSVAVVLVRCSSMVVQIMRGARDQEVSHAEATLCASAARCARRTPGPQTRDQYPCPRRLDLPCPADRAQLGRSADQRDCPRARMPPANGAGTAPRLQRARSGRAGDASRLRAQAATERGRAQRHHRLGAYPPTRQARAATRQWRFAGARRDQRTRMDPE